ncbi:vacuolar protein sorting-associated protein 13 [Eremomyces bilateralis CBS 781.70]|uniref:Vacuolar protein sorting-associated protein n=1 Tax=Eremomyces bilateralis CBS 781.70 TaxID=1392243 RepID=A0A6G1G2E0_9PEZI|nr:vacuolar protein sorting-associated protein 13 [Eremomyces bilateralis CBS 781.70]KAF1812213.1 vacuolar protein sorting-associated protein 13 [Eremomyces bilateralis CBS 781.70]
MLESVVANLLNRFLGMYVQNFDPKQLNVGIWSGDVKLRNMELRREALDQLRLPLNVIEGHLGQLTLQIPWSNLRGKPVRVIIEDVFLLAAPKVDTEYDVDEEERRQHAVKMEKLDSAELLKDRNTEGMSQEEQQKNQSFTASFVTAIVDNVQVSVKNIHIRYEDSISHPGHPFALGITLEGFDAVSTEADWRPTFIQSTSGTTHKLASLKSLAVYWDTDNELLSSGVGTQEGLEHDDFVERLKSMIARTDETDLDSHQYLLKPVTGRAGLEIDKSGKLDRPKMKAKLLFDELGFIMDNDQYRDALMLVDLFHYYIRHQEYRKLQPKSKPKEDPRAWIQFAGQAVLDKIHERNRRWSWEYFKERRDDRIRYIDFFKKKKKDVKLTPDEATDLDELERKLTYEDLRFWRSLARNQLRKENVGVKKEPPQQTWSQWIWGANKPSQEEAPEDRQMTDEQRKELYEAIDWDEKKSIEEAVDVPKEYVKLQVEMSLRTGSFTLRRQPHGKKTEILKLLFDSFRTELLRRTDSMLARVDLEGMRLYDGTTKGSLFPQIISIKDAPAVPDEERIKELDDDEMLKEGEKSDGNQDEDAAEDDPFFHLEFENNPLDGSADTALTVKLKALEIIYNPKFLEGIVKFFKPPKRHMESIGALMETAGATVEGIRKQTRAGLEFALEEHKTINANLDLQAPLIIIPDSVTEKSSLCLIVDAGHASVRSKLVDKGTLRDVQNKQHQRYTEEDYRRLEGLMYDRFLLKLDSTQLLLGTTIGETKKQLAEDTESRSFHLVERINMDFTLDICIIPKASTLTKFRISGHLPVLHASVSDKKYKSLMKLIDVAIPKFTDESERNQEKKIARSPSPPPTNTDELGRPRSKSFQFSGDEVAQSLVVDEEESDTSSQREKAESEKKDAELLYKQRNFEFNFTVDKLVGSLYRADPEGKKADDLLVELVANAFSLQFYQRPFDMAAEVKLKSLVVEDHVEEDPSPEFKNIVSSDDLNTASEKDLFYLKFTRVNPKSPEFQSVYDGIAMNVDAAVSAINVIVTRRTLLTLLDFVLTTFTGGDNQRVSQQVSDAKMLEDKPEEQVVRPQPSQDKIRVRTELKKISLILNNDGIRLATLSLSSADVGVFIMGKSMRVGARLGDLSLIDDVNQGVPEDSSLRQLVTIQGKELADFSYETFDSQSESYPGYDSSIFLRAGSIKVNFVTEPFRKIMDFTVKFGKMQAIFNAARQAAAQQASQMQETANKMHFDILVRTPIVVFPRIVFKENTERDTLTAYLGEIYAKNEFVAPKGGDSEEHSNHINAGIRHIRMASNFHYGDGQSEALQLLDKTDLSFEVNYIEHKPGMERPDMEIAGSLSDTNLRVTQDQLKFILELFRTIPPAFAMDPGDEMQEDVYNELPESTAAPARALTERSQESSESQASDEPPSGNWTTLDLVFKAPTIGVELINAAPNEPVKDLEDASLSKFSLNRTHVKLRMMKDGALESELLIRSFSIRDSRTRDSNKFRKIMSLINNDVKQQFMASISISGGKERSLVAMLTIDSPRMILALDYLFSIQAFINAGLTIDEPLEVDEETETTATDAESSVSLHSEGRRTKGTQAVSKLDTQTGKSEGREMQVSFRVNVVDAQVILLANPAITNTEAVVLGTKQVLVSKQNAMTLQVDRVGMFLCRMDQFETTRLRILDDFSVRTSLDIQTQGKSTTRTNIHVDVDPLILRLSLRDILLAMQILARASEMSGGTEKKIEDHEPKKLKEIKGTSSKSSRPKSSRKDRSTAGAPRAKSLSAAQSQAISADVKSARQPGVIQHEEMDMEIGGIRVVLIGDKHELPMLDWSVKKFNVQVRDWTGAMTADTSIDTYFNVFNFSKSAWEPLIEPWQLGFHMSKDQNPDKLSVELYTRKSMEVTVTAATIALASKSADFLSTDEDVLSKPRGMEAPYKLRNYTGFDINVWGVTDSSDGGPAAKLTDGDECPWRFEDPLTTRETLSPEGATGIVGVRLEGSGFDSVEKVPVNREGEVLYNLRPRKNKVQHRLLVEVSLGTDNVKYITFRSPLLVENNTQIPIELGVYNPDEGHILKIEKIPPGDARPAPVGAAYLHSLIVRPDQGFGYTWSSERLFWGDLLKRQTRTITCHGEHDDHAPPFYFQMHANFDKRNPIVGNYPYMRIRLSAPVEIQNLLPYDFKYRIFDHQTKKDWTNFLRKGGVSPVHVVELSHLLMMSIEMQDTPFKQSEFAVINSSDRENFRREKTMEVKDNNNLSLQLKLHYFNIPDSGGAFKVTLYSPYIILNRTGLPIDLRSKVFMGSTKSAAGQPMDADSDDARAMPLMFSFPTDDRKNRALIKVGDSHWSKPQSFDAIGSTYDVTLPSSTGRSEMHIGVSVAEGEGKYNLTKVVTLGPRFIVKNRLSEEINVREPGSSDIMTLKPGDLLPLRFLRQRAGQQLSICFPGVNNTWSSPFNIADVGSVHVKLAKSGQRQKLMRIDVLMEHATLFLHISTETKHWPFSMRNESNTEFIFYQTNPNLDEDEEERTTGWKPIRYRLPPRSIMPYAWDYPAARRKEIVLRAEGKERHVKLAEIGNPPPMKLPPTSPSGRGKIIDLNIVAEGPTQSLLLSNYKPSKSLYRQHSNAASQSGSTGFEVKDVDTDVNFTAQIRFAGLGVSLINSQLKELVYVTLRDIEIKYSDSPLYQTVKSTIKWIQIDNQLYGGIFPIILYPSVVPKTGKEMEAHPILHAAITKVKDDSYGVIYIKYFTVLLQQLTIEIDEDFIFALLDFVKIPGASWSEEKQGKLCDEALDIPEPTQDQSSQDIYFELLHLQPMQFDLSFVRTERINAEDTATSNNPLMFAVNVLTMSIGNVNDAPIKYNALMLENARVSMATLINNIRTHYVQESLRQVHIVLGSADFLGNPVGLFNNVSSGIQDIFYEPYQGLVMTDRPQDLGIGIAKGASSFVKKSVFGFSDSMAKWTGSVSKGLSAATLDKEYQDQRRMSRARNRPKHALYGITSGGNAFASSLASGIGGLARHPIQGAEKEGVAGFVKGVGKGFLGLATKPAIGAFDLASNMAEGVRNTTTVFDQEGLDRVRLTRFIGQDGIVRPYSQRESLGQFWLKTVDNGKYFNDDYIAHLELEGRDMIVILTYNGIMLVRSKRLTSEWDVPLKDIQTISKERTGMSITLKGGTNGPFIPIQDEPSRNWLYRQIAVAVNAYNDKWSAAT